MQLCAYGKINLTLDVMDRRADGYHNISSVMQTVGLFDELDIELNDIDGYIDLRLDGPYLHGAPEGAENLVHRAARAFLTATSASHGVTIHLTKFIPSQSGLGGGSSDAAATLRGLNLLLDKPFTREQLMPIAVSLGADVPFFLYGGTCVVEGIGDRVTPTADIALGDVIIVKPPVGIPTTDAFGALDEHRGSDIKSAPRLSPWDYRTFYNDFEDVILPANPTIAQIREKLIDAGCRVAMLCGSGGAVFGIVGQDLNPRDVFRQLSHESLGSAFMVRAIPADE